MAEAKKKAEVTNVTMEDGRTVGFAGARKMLKETLIDDSKIVVGEDGSVMLAPGAVKVRIDFRNGKTIEHTPPAALLARYAGHGGEQKLGDEAAGEKEVDDAQLAIEDLAKRLEAGEWNVAREGSGGFAGASLVVKAIIAFYAEKGQEKSVDQIKAFLDEKLASMKAAAAAKGEKEPTRQQLYATFKNPNSKVGQIYKRLEEEKAAGAKPAFNADEALEAA